MSSIGNAVASIDVIGRGQDVLLLPALSSISTRREMHPLADQLRDGFRCRIPDWPGFGGPAFEGVLSPDVMRHFLDAITANDGGAPLIGIAAGHAATYLVEAATRHAGRFARLVLIAPTWRGPLPTMVGGRRPALCRQVRTMLERPVIGPLLFKLNVSRPVVARMMLAHVYAAPSRLTPAVLADKLAVAQRRGGRFATAAFVTGGLDPAASREGFLGLFGADLPPTLVIRPDDAPPRSAAEMDALRGLGHLRFERVSGALAAHEEYPRAVGLLVRRFLDPA